MAHWQMLERTEALSALEDRQKAIEAEITRLGNIQIDQQPLPDFVEALFDYALGQLRAEEQWLAQTLGYMTSKPWLEE